MIFPLAQLFPPPLDRRRYLLFRHTQGCQPKGSRSAAPLHRSLATNSRSVPWRAINVEMHGSSLKWVRNCSGNYFFPFWDFFLDLLFCPFSLQFAAFWSWKLPFQRHCNIWSSNLPFSMIFAAFWRSNFSCWMVFCD